MAGMRTRAGPKATRHGFDAEGASEGESRPLRYDLGCARNPAGRPGRRPARLPACRRWVGLSPACLPEVGREVGRNETITQFNKSARGSKTEEKPSREQREQSSDRTPSSGPPVSGPTRSFPGRVETQRFATIRKDSQRNAKIRNDSQRFAKIRNDSQRFAKFRKGV